jgi:cytoskeleton protein RodZ
LESCGLDEGDELGSFGEQLRQARESHNISLQEIASATKISSRALQALESEQFSQLPGGIFNKGFVRAYARYVGLDEEKMVSAYLEAAKVEASETDIQTMSSQITAARAGARDSAVNGTTMVGVLALLVALGLGAVWLKEHRREAREQAAAVSAEQSAASQAASPAAPVVGGPGTVAGAASTGAQNVAQGAAQNATQNGTQSQRAASNTAPGAAGTASANPAAPVEVSISASQRAWISVRSDGKKVESVTLDPDKPELRSRDYKANEKLILVVGNLGGLTVTYNGKPAGTLGAVGQTATITFTPQGIQKQ